MRDNHKALVAARFGLLAAFLFLWELVTGGFGLDIVLFEPLILPSPSSIWQAIVEYWQSGLLLTDMRATLWAAFLGLLLGVIGGALAGVLLGYWRLGAALLEPAMVAVNSLPRITVAPLSLIHI